MKLWGLIGGCLWLAGVGLLPQTSVAAESGSVATNAPPDQPQVQQRAAQGAVDVWLKRVKTHDPQEFERLSKLRQENPEAFQKELKERLEKIRANKRGDLSLDVAASFKSAPGERGAFAARSRDGGKQRDPHQADLNKQEQEIHKLAASYKTATSAEKQKLQAELKKKITDVFELREQSRRESIQRLEVQLVQLKKDADNRKSNRDAIIERRLKELAEGSFSQPPQ